MRERVSRASSLVERAISGGRTNSWCHYNLRAPSLCNKDKPSQFPLTRSLFRESLHVSALFCMYCERLRYIPAIHTYKNVCIIAPDFNSRCWFYPTRCLFCTATIFALFSFEFLSALSCCTPYHRLYLRLIASCIANCIDPIRDRIRITRCCSSFNFTYRARYL